MIDFLAFIALNLYKYCTKTFRAVSSLQKNAIKRDRKLQNDAKTWLYTSRLYLSNVFDWLSGHLGLLLLQRGYHKFYFCAISFPEHTRWQLKICMVMSRHQQRGFVFPATLFALKLASHLIQALQKCNFRLSVEDHYLLSLYHHTWISCGQKDVYRPVHVA